MEALEQCLLQHVPIRFLKNQLNQIDSSCDQIRLLSFLHSANNVGYSRSILNHLINFRESQNLNVDEHVYQEYGDLITIVDNSSADLHKVVYGNDIIIYEEPNILLQEGCTGYRTWEAAIVLTDYLSNIESQNLFGALPVIELGAGTGLTGITIAKNKFSQQVILTDENSDVVQIAERNINANNVQDVASGRVLGWGTAEADMYIKKMSPCWIVAADVTYDELSFPDLLSSLALAVPRVLLSCTIRSQKTSHQLQKECKKMGLSLEKVHSVPAGGGLYKSGFISPESPEIIVYKLSKTFLD